MFTIRVYGLLIHYGNVLVSDEIIKGLPISKFPGGGLEYGEGSKDCLIREINEEVGVDALDLEHFYTTDFFQQSAFHDHPMQVISVYYTFKVASPETISVVTEPLGGKGAMFSEELFRWLPLENAKPEALSLPIDRVVLSLLKQLRSYP